MQTRRDIIKCGAGLAAIIAAGQAPAAIVRSMMAARNAMSVNKSGQPAEEYWGLCFTAEEAGSTVGMVKYGSPKEITLLSSTDGNTWNVFTVGETTITLANVGDKVWLKAGEGGNANAIGGGNISRNQFSLSGIVSVSGEIQSLINGSELSFTVPIASCFRYLFSGCSSLRSASGLKLSATTLTSLCYSSLFYNCTSLENSPIMPSVQFTSRCFERMFWGCSSLSRIVCEFDGWTGNVTDAFTNWVTDVAPTGTFVCPAALGTNSSITRGTSYCPTGWTVVNT